MELPETSKLRVGIVGIGGFGSRAAMRLLWTGFTNLLVYDTHEQTPRMFTGNHGGLSMGSPKMLAQQSDIVITALPSAAAMRDAFFGWEGLATGFAGQGVVMDIGTTDPLKTVEMAKELAGHNVKLVDAPAFGTPQDARDGKLTMVVGGDDDAVAKCQPILDKLAAKIVRAGATGSAQAAVAIADYVRAARLLAASEAIRLGSHFGYEPGKSACMCEALGGAQLTDVLQNEVATRRFKTGMQLGMLHENIVLAERVAKASGLVLPLLEKTETMLKQAEDRLGYSMDASGVLKWLETLTPPKAEAEAEAPAEKKTGPA